MFIGWLKFADVSELVAIADEVGWLVDGRPGVVGAALGAVPVAGLAAELRGTGDLGLVIERKGLQKQMDPEV